MAKVNYRQYLILALLWLAYASSYLLRKPLALVKVQLLTDLNLNPALLGWLDVALLAPYAGVSLMMGWVADKLGGRKVLGGGLVLSALAGAGLGYTTSFPVMLVLLFACGAFQSLCWPAAGSILGNWVRPVDQNHAFGLFGTSCFAGSVLATYMAVYLLQMRGWRGVFVPCAAVPGIMGAAVLLLARSRQQCGVSGDHPMEEKSNRPATPTTTRSLSLLQVLRLPLLPQVCFAIFCTKCLRYAVLLWLPMFLEKSLNYTAVAAGIGSTAYDVGGIFGSLLLGILVQRVFHGNNYWATAMICFLNATFLLLFYVSGDMGITVHMLLLALAGLFNSAADVLLTGTVAVSLGTQHGASVTISGVINGMGSVGSVVQGPLVAWVASSLGWGAVVPLLVLLAGSGGLAALIAYRREGLVVLQNDLPTTVPLTT